MSGCFFNIKRILSLSLSLFFTYIIVFFWRDNTSSKMLDGNIMTTKLVADTFPPRTHHDWWSCSLLYCPTESQWNSRDVSVPPSSFFPCGYGVDYGSSDQVGDHPCTYMGSEYDCVPFCTQLVVGTFLPKLL